MTNEISYDNLGETPLFVDLSPEIISSLDPFIRQEHIPAGSILIAEGDFGHNFYVILKGRASVYLSSDDSQLSERVAGDWFGAVALLHKTTRTANVKAITDMEIVVVSDKHFPNFLAALPDKIETEIKSSALDRIVTTIQNLPIFEGVPADQMTDLAKLFTYEIFKPGEVVITEGDVGDKFYIILRGSAKVTKLSGAENVYLDTRVVGEWFGAVALLKKTLRTASITASDDLTLMVLEERNFIDFLKSLPPALQKTVNEFAIERTVSVINVFKTGEVAAKEGDSDAKLYFVLRGIAKLTQASQRVGAPVKSLGTYQQNELFGEDALLKSTSKQRATVTCVTTCAFLTLTHEAFNSFMAVSSEGVDLRIAINKHRVKKGLLGPTLGQ